MTTDITNRIKLLTNYNVKNTLTENVEKLNNDQFVFDFVLSENNKYLIIMDQLFVANGDGNSIGSIWENTHIFNEILIESINNVATLTESIKTDLVSKITNIKWSKEIIKESISTNIILEQEKSLWDSFTSGVSNLADKIGQANIELITKIFNQGVLPFLRWVRRSAYTNIGLVIDVVMSFLAVKSSAIVWGIIVLLDIYEIATGDYDPQDSDRKMLPYLLLIGDVLAFLFSGVISVTWKALAKQIHTQGIKKVAPKFIPYLEKLAEKIPSLKSMLTPIANTLTQKFGSSGIISLIIRSIDKILGGLMDFLNKLFSREGLKATLSGVAVLGTVKGAEHYMNNMSQENSEKMATKLVDFDQKMRNRFGYTEPKNDMEDDEILNTLKNLGHI